MLNKDCLDSGNFRLDRKVQQALSHEFIRNFRAFNPHKRPVLIAVSGGADSILLLHLLQKWRRLLGCKLAVAHVHHGPLPKMSQKFRLQAAKVVKAQAADLPFFSNVVWRSSRQISLSRQPNCLLKSEAELRDFRWNLLKGWQTVWSQQLQTPVVIATAHSADDLLETRLLRLIRGTGPQGLTAMQGESELIIRPLLTLQSRTIRHLARAEKIKWCEDPSNQSLEPKRNWLRKKWLPMLEKRYPGSTRALARSLETIVAEITHSTAVKSVKNERLLTTSLAHKTRHQQRQMLASFFRQHNLQNYSERHLDEVLKRLDKPRKRHSFSLLGRVWEFDGQYLRLGRDSKSKMVSP